MDIVKQVLEQTRQDAEKYPQIYVNKDLDLEFDIGSLAARDLNKLDESINWNSPASEYIKVRSEYLLKLTRDNTQLLFNQIFQLPTERQEEAIVVRLPPPSIVLPRSKPVPRPKPPTKWEEFARAKGIVKKKKTKVSWDKQLKDWTPRYGYKKVANEKLQEWLIEVPQNADPMEDQFAKKQEAKQERVSKNELQRLRNLARAKKIKVPKMGVPNPDIASAKEIQTAITVARSSTASLGKFQSKLPKEKEARGVADLIPGTSRKRKMPPLSEDQERETNMRIIDIVVPKKAKLDLGIAISKHLNNESSRGSDNNRPKKGKGKKSRKNDGAPKGGKKPSSAQGKKGGKSKGGRKRR